jgi:magnesium chelatase family protein
MISQAQAATLSGIEALLVTVEVDLQGQVPMFILVGLPDKAVQESVERVRAAIRNSGLQFPLSKIVCNLAPGDIRKEGPSMDLPIAAAVLAASGQIAEGALKDVLLLGELGLDGVLRPIDGALNIALMAREKGMKKFILPEVNAAEAAVAPGLEVYGVRTLLDAVELLNGSLLFTPHRLDEASRRPETLHDVDFSEIKGQRMAVRALEIAAAGGHNVLMTGPPGSGKTMLARRLPTILPPLTLEEAMEVTRIYSAGGNKRGREGLLWERPFRSPHHATSYAAIVGGGAHPKPGEVSLSHHGVLFMDEMPEFSREVLEALRQPLEDGVVTVARVQQTLTFPAQCVLIAAMNPCPCGFKGYPEAKCVGAALCERYGAKVSGPLLDRIDLQITVPRLAAEELVNREPSESSAAIRARVLAARDRQAARFGRAHVNGKMNPRELRDLVKMDAGCEEFMRTIAERMKLSGRVFDRLLKVARTIADLAGEPDVRREHLAEAVQYRGAGRA